MTPQQLFPLDLLPPSYHRENNPLLDQVPSHSLRGTCRYHLAYRRRWRSRQLLRLFLPFSGWGSVWVKDHPRKHLPSLSTWPCQKPLIFCLQASLALLSMNSFPTNYSKH